MDATGKLERWRLGQSEFDFKIVHQAVSKYQVVEGLLNWPTNRIDKYPLEDDVLVMMTTEEHPEGLNTRTDTKIWYSLP